MATTTIMLRRRPQDPPDEEADRAVAGTQSLADAMANLPWLPPSLRVASLPAPATEADDHQPAKRAG